MIIHLMGKWGESQIGTRFLVPNYQACDIVPGSQA